MLACAYICMGLGGNPAARSHMTSWRNVASTLKTSCMERCQGVKMTSEFQGSSGIWISLDMVL